VGPTFQSVDDRLDQQAGLPGLSHRHRGRPLREARCTKAENALARAAPPSTGARHQAFADTPSSFAAPPAPARRRAAGPNIYLTYSPRQDLFLAGLSPRGDRLGGVTHPTVAARGHNVRGRNDLRNSKHSRHASELSARSAAPGEIFCRLRDAGASVAAGPTCCGKVDWYHRQP
jgi:hypothetical protein